MYRIILAIARRSVLLPAGYFGMFLARINVVLESSESEPSDSENSAVRFAKQYR